MKVRINPEQLPDELRLRDADSFVVLEMLRWKHQDNPFDLTDGTRYEMPGGTWHRTRFGDTRARLIRSKYLLPA